MALRSLSPGEIAARSLNPPIDANAPGILDALMPDAPPLPLEPRPMTTQTPPHPAPTSAQGTPPPGILSSSLSSPTTTSSTANLSTTDSTSLSGLREISSLASWTVSSHKPGCGVPALRSPSVLQFWQSDGPQPHLLNIHFFKLVSIVKLRVYLDFDLDESYTPTRMVFAAGMGMYDLTEFAEWAGDNPKGWVDVNLEGVGPIDGGFEGERGDQRDSLRCMIVQVRVCENYQNGKDTHVRGVQLFARDEREGRRGRRVVGEVEVVDGKDGQGKGDGEREEVVGLEEADWMGEPELR